MQYVLAIGVTLLLVDWLFIGVIPLLLGRGEPAHELLKEGVIKKLHCGIRTNLVGKIKVVDDATYATGQGVRVWITEKSIAVKWNYLTYKFKVDRSAIVDWEIIRLGFHANALRLTVTRNESDKSGFIDIISNAQDIESVITIVFRETVENKQRGRNYRDL